MEYFQWKFPCDPSELVHFRKRVGEAGVEEIFKISIELHAESALEKEVIIDTTVQEKNIVFPTDTKLRMKVIGKCWKLADEEGICLRRSYRRELKEILRTIRFSKGQKNKKKVKPAVRRVKTIANALLRDVARKLPQNRRAVLRDEIEQYLRVVNQERHDKKKIYSLHEPEVSCICKGKEHKKYEFGSKAAIVMTKTLGIIVGAKSFSGNPYDGDTLESTLSQVKTVRGTAPEIAYCDRGFRGRKRVGDTDVSIPGTPQPETTEHDRRKARKNFARRSAIEPIIGHLKSDFRLARNFLKGSFGDAINLLMAAAAFNCRKWMRALAHTLYFALVCLWARSPREKTQSLTVG